MRDFENEPVYGEKEELERPAFVQPEGESYEMKRYMQRIIEEQNLLLAVVGGAGGAVVGALLWGVITYLTEYQIGWMAVGVGVLVGLAVRYLGKGLDMIYGVIGAGFSLIGCLAGNFLAIILFFAKFQEIPILDVLLFFSLTPTLIIEIMVESFEIIDLLFYGFAVYQGYRMAFRPISQEEIDKAMGTGRPLSF